MRKVIAAVVSIGALAGCADLQEAEPTAVEMEQPAAGMFCYFDGKSYSLGGSLGDKICTYNRNNLAGPDGPMWKRPGSM